MCWTTPICLSAKMTPPSNRALGNAAADFTEAYREYMYFLERCALARKELKHLKERIALGMKRAGLDNYTSTFFEFRFVDGLLKQKPRQDLGPRRKK